MTIRLTPWFIEVDTIDVTVIDDTDSPLSMTKSFILNVIPSQEAPQFIESYFEEEAIKNDPFIYQVTPIDSDTNELIILTVTSSNQSLIPADSISIDLVSSVSNNVRSVSLSPLYDELGETLITMIITDEDSNQNRQQFLLTIDTILNKGKLVDNRDGQIYNWIKIGNQTWMAENLKTTLYSDGSSLVDGTGAGDINGDYTTKYYFYYDDDSATNSETYGALYTWAAAMNNENSSGANPSGINGVCPDGWHLPSDNEWKELEIYLGMSQTGADSTGWRGTNEGTLLKATNGWNNGGNGTDIYDFFALPGGYRYDYLGTFHNKGDYGYWWSSTEFNSLRAYRRAMGYGYANLNRGYYDKPGGFSVRCLRDYPLSDYLTISTDTLDFTEQSANVGDIVEAFQFINISNKRDILITGLSGLEPPFSVNPLANDTVKQLSSLSVSITLNTDTLVDTYTDTLVIETNFADTFIIVTAQIIDAGQTFTDARDGNTYKWVQIGEQIWMAENLAYLPSVYNVTDGSEDNATGEYYYVYGYDGTNVISAKATGNYQTYGVLYNWNAAMNRASASSANPSGVRGVCPSGWHLPSDDEWEELAQFISDDLGPYSKNNDDWLNVGGHLKTTSGWNNNGNGTDDYGFSGLPGGIRLDDGSFQYIGYDGFWYNASEDDADYAWDRYLDLNYSNLYRNRSKKVDGRSVRCIKNDAIIKLSENSMNFGIRFIGCGDTTQQIVIYNTGDSTFTINSITGVSFPYDIMGDIIGSVTSGDSAILSIALSTDTVAGTYTDDISINTTAGNESVLVTVNIQYNPAVSAPVAHDTTFCEWEANKYITATGQNLRWYDNSSFTDLFSDDDTLVLSSASVGTADYYITQTINNCTSSPETLTVTILEASVIAFINKTDETTCNAGDGAITITATGTAPLEYSIDNGNSFSASTTFSPLTRGNYATIVKNGYGCLAYGDTITISSSDAPGAPVVSNDTSYCDGDQPDNITATATGDITWYSDVLLTTVLSQSSSITPSNSIGTTIYYATQTVNGCESASSEVDVTINPIPDAPDVTDNYSCPGDNNTSVSASGTEIRWYSDAGLSSFLQLGSIYTPTVTNIGDHYYYATQTVNNCESDYNYVTYTIRNRPLVNLGNDTAVCDGEVYTLDPGPGFVSYNWLDGFSSNQQLILYGSLYNAFVEVTDSYNCKGFDTVEVIYIKPVILEICMVSVISDQNNLYWKIPETTHTRKYYIERKRSGEDDTQFITIDSLNPVSHTYLDEGVDPENGPYVYRLYSRDSCGNESDTGKRHINLKLDIYYGHNLGWTAYKGNTVDRYEIYRGSSATNLTLYDQVSESVTSWSDPNPLSGTNYYKVAADFGNMNATCNLSGDNANKSFSNIVDDTGLGINKYGFDAFRIYPVPADNYLIIESTWVNQNLHIVITDISGAIVYRYISDKSESKIKINTQDRINSPSDFASTLKSDGLENVGLKLIVK
ncbi:FISUMP domain-containing protein [Bacteroidota bacterium]